MPVPKSSSAKRQPMPFSSCISSAAFDRFEIAVVSVISKHSSPLGSW